MEDDDSVRSVIQGAPITPSPKYTQRQSKTDFAKDRIRSILKKQRISQKIKRTNVKKRAHTRKKSTRLLPEECPFPFSGTNRKSRFQIQHTERFLVQNGNSELTIRPEHTTS